MPGLVDPSQGRVRHAVNVGLEDVPLVDILRNRYAVDVKIENDVNVAALGAAHLLDIRGSLAYLNLGTGVAVGFIDDGRIRRDAGGLAGEIGHLPVAPGPRCKCGQFGCLEILIAGPGLASQWPRGDSNPIEDLFNQSDIGDEAACRVLASFIERLAWTVQLITLATGPEAVVLGGGVMALGDRIAGPLRTHFLKDAEQSPLLGAIGLHRRIRVLSPHSKVASIGAALLGAESSKQKDKRENKLG